MQQRTHRAPPSKGPFGLLPDADRDPHPRRTWLVETGFDVVLGLAYRREIVYPGDYRLDPGTLIASNHQRDVDGPMLGTVLVRRRGLHFTWPLPFYATREDLFRPGILSRLTMHWPKPVSALLGHVSLAWFFPLGRAEPIRRVREFTLGETLRALIDAGCGDDDGASLLNARGRRETGAAPGAFPLRALLERDDIPLESWWGLRRLSPPAFGKLAPAFRNTVEMQLRGFARRLDEGRCVYFSPEGSISIDGRFGRIRGGFFRLCRMTATPPRILPMGIAYDTLAAGRPRVVIRIGRPFLADLAASRREFDARLRAAILALVSVTPSHLVARFLACGPARFGTADLAGWLRRMLDTAARQGVALDPLFARIPPERLAEQRLRWLARKRLIVRDGDAWRNAWPHGACPGWRKPADVVRYLSNGLEDLLPGQQPADPEGG